MRVAIISPNSLSATGGNVVTVQRISQQLQLLGCEIALFSPGNDGDESLIKGVRNFSPDIIHAFHAVRCGGLAGCLAAENDIPYIITMTGTDIYHPDDSGVNNSEGLCGAAALVFFADGVREDFTRAHPSLVLSATVIPQGVVVPDSYVEEPPATAGCTFFLPAGIRAVKNVLFPFEPLAQLQRRFSQTRLLLAGGVLEPAYTARLIDAVAIHPFAHWVGEVAFAQMPVLYNSAHVVLNCSHSEGGMANSLLEGMAYGRAILAAEIEGNRSLVRDGENGFLYRDADDFIIKAEMLLLDKSLRRAMGAAGRAYVAVHCSPVLEAERYLRLYVSCCQ